MQNKNRIVWTASSIMFFFVVYWVTGSFKLITIIFLIFISMYLFWMKIDEPKDVKQISCYSYINKIFSKVKCEDYLCEVIDDAIEKKEIPIFDKYNLKQLQLMLCYATMRRGVILKRISVVEKFIYIGIGIFISAFFYILLLNYPKTLILWLDLLDIIGSHLLDLGNFEFLMVFWIVLLILSPFRFDRRTRYSVWIEKHENVNKMYGYTPAILSVIIFVICMWFSNIRNKISLISGLFLIAGGYSEEKLLTSFLNVNEEIILHLNKSIIFHK